MVFVILADAARKGELILVQDGYCHWHKSKNGVVTIYEIMVLPNSRMKGIGRKMLAEVEMKNLGCVIRAKCPVKYPSNRWWAQMGFRLIETVKGNNIWERP